MHVQPIGALAGGADPQPIASGEGREMLLMSPHIALTVK
jgi:hypothetical protein